MNLKTAYNTWRKLDPWNYPPVTNEEIQTARNLAEAAKITTSDGFNVWVSTYGLYNAGDLTGYWCDAGCVPTTILEFMAGLPESTLSAEYFLENLGEELHCFDTENAPFDGECSPETAITYANFIDVLDGNRGLYIHDAATTIALIRAANLDPGDSLTDIEDRFAGVRDSEKEYAQEFFEDTTPAENVFTNWPYSCIDWDQATRELMMDFTTYDLPDGRVAIFWQ